MIRCTREICLEGIKRMGKHDKWVDCLRGYACLLVVFGHVIMGIRKSGGVYQHLSILWKDLYGHSMCLYFSF